MHDQDDQSVSAPLAYRAVMCFLAPIFIFYAVLMKWALHHKKIATAVYFLTVIPVIPIIGGGWVVWIGAFVVVYPVWYTAVYVMWASPDIQKQRVIEWIDRWVD